MVEALLRSAGPECLTIRWKWLLGPRGKLAGRLRLVYPVSVSTVQEIKAAIKSLSSAQRKELAASLPSLVPELDGDAAWEGIIRDERPRPALSALLDRAEAEYQRDPAACPETSDEEFGRNP